MENTIIHNDRISDLPDVLLIHILSFLKTKEAVQTCVLSQRWKNLWSFVPSLHFDFDDFLPDDVDHDDLKEYEIKFEQFVSAVLQNRDTSILDSFKLFYYYAGKSEAITEWILYALNCKPRVLYFEVDRDDEIDLPDMLFNCKSLEKMTLRVEAFLPYMNVSKTINLPSIKKLELSAWIIDDYFMNKLMSGCPVLEELILSRCVVDTQIISSNLLKHLSIDDFRSKREIQISIPSLSSLVIESGNGCVILKNMSSLVKARLVLFSYRRDIGNQVYGILNGLSNATNLEFVLTGHGAKVILKKELSNCPTFKNLKSLHFDGYMISDFDLIALFLQHAPNLEKLTLIHREPYPLPDAAQKNTSKTEIKTGDSQYQYVPLVEIIYKEDHKRVDQLVKTLRTYVKSIGELNMFINRAK